MKTVECMCNCVVSIVRAYCSGVGGCTYVLGVGGEVGQQRVDVVHDVVAAERGEIRVLAGGIF